MTNPYDNFKYISVDRWASYWHQIKTVSSLNPSSVLEIGVGSHIVYDYFKSRGFDITSLDIDTETNPDVVGSVQQIPFEENKFDAVLCAEVLEHLPFESFVPALKEIRRVTKSHAVITLPHWGRHFSIDIRLPFVKRVRGQFKVSFPPKKQHLNSPHRWEIGKRGTPLRIVKNATKEAGFLMLKNHILFEMPYHHLFVLKK